VGECFSGTGSKSNLNVNIYGLMNKNYQLPLNLFQTKQMKKYNSVKSGTSNTNRKNNLHSWNDKQYVMT